MFLGKNKRGSKISLRAEQNCIQHCMYTRSHNSKWKSSMGETDQFTPAGHSWELHNWKEFMPNLFISPLCGQKWLKWQWLLGPLLFLDNGLCGGFHQGRVRMGGDTWVEIPGCLKCGVCFQKLACCLCWLREQKEEEAGHEWLDCDAVWSWLWKFEGWFLKVHANNSKMLRMKDDKWKE